MIFKLNLENDLTYKEMSLCFNDIYDKKPGAETCFCYNAYFDDIILKLDLLWSGYHKPLSQKEKVIIETGLPPLKRENENKKIKRGEYNLLQTIPVENEKNLLRVLLPFFVKSSSSKVYVRFFKENIVETIMQIFVEV